MHKHLFLSLYLWVAYPHLCGECILQGQLHSSFWENFPLQAFLGSLLSPLFPPHVAQHASIHLGIWPKMNLQAGSCLPPPYLQLLHQPLSPLTDNFNYLLTGPLLPLSPSGFSSHQSGPFKIKVGSCHPCPRPVKAPPGVPHLTEHKIQSPSTDCEALPGPHLYPLLYFPLQTHLAHLDPAPLADFIFLDHSKQPGSQVFTLGVPSARQSHLPEPTWLGLSLSSGISSIISVKPFLTCLNETRSPTTSVFPMPPLLHFSPKH